MLDFLNQLKPNTNVDPAAGLVGGKKSVESGQGEEFKAMLEQAKNPGESDLLKALTQNYEASKDLSSVEASKANAQELIEGETEVPTLKELAQTERKSFFPNAKAAQDQPLTQVATKKDEVVNLEKLLGKSDTKVTGQEIAKQSVKTAADFPEGLKVKAATGTEAQALTTADSQMSLKLAPQLHKTNSKAAGKAESMLQYSEDFISTKVTQNGSEKPVVTGNKQALNLFQKEQSNLNGGSLFKNTQTNVNELSSVFDSSAKETATTKLNSATIDSEMAAQGSLEQAPEGLTFAPKVATANVLTTSTNAEVKVLDMTGVQSNDQLINEITNYIESSRFQNGKSLELIVNHQELGQFKVHAQKAGGELVQLQIQAATDEAQQFFKNNEVKLLKTLATNGVKVSDLNITAGFTANNSSSTGSNGGNDSSGQNFTGSEQHSKGQSNSGQNFHQDGRQRRQELWDQYRQRQTA